jgi:hypothetical protein
MIVISDSRIWNEWQHIGIKRYVSNNISGCLPFHGGKLKNRLERADLDNVGMDWKRKPPPGRYTKGNKTFSRGLEYVIC